MHRIVDRRNIDFILFEMIDLERFFGHHRYKAYDRNTVEQILDSAQEISQDIFLPIAAEVDANEPVFSNGRVILPQSTKDALRVHAEAGFLALPFDYGIGGHQAPWILHTVASGLFSAANTISGYSLLTVAASNLINTFATDGLRRLFLPPMLSGRWFGTMCLSEVQAGSSLADIRTQAIAGPDGLYRIRGTKMWISGGDHELSENIVHMVLAKIPGGPAGTKGISLFLVPKFRVGEDGTAGEFNNIALAGLNHKMGQRGTTNCVLNFGEAGECLGYLVGEPNRGLEYMFHMMNEARIAVGHSAVTSALSGYLYSLDYARSRTQGRPIDRRDSAGPQIPIIEHADVRRMLMAQKAAVEGAQALCLYCCSIVDELAIAENAEEKSRLKSLLSLLTPVVKSWPSEHCLEANKWAIQVLGGYGYSRDYPVERLYRDNRLNHIHEGTFGIQGLDLVERKIGADGGQPFIRFMQLMRDMGARASDDNDLDEEAARLLDCLDVLSETTECLLGCADVAVRIANATVYLDAFGHVVIGWMWLWQALVARRALSSEGVSERDREFYLGKIQACRYFTRYELPLARERLLFCRSLDTTCLDMTPEAF